MPRLSYKEKQLRDELGKQFQDAFTGKFVKTKSVEGVKYYLLAIMGGMNSGDAVSKAEERRNLITNYFPSAVALVSPDVHGKNFAEIWVRRA